MNLDLPDYKVEVAGDTPARRDEIRARLEELEGLKVRSLEEYEAREREIRRLLDLLG